MQKLRVGIIGAGRIGQVHAKSITYHIPQAEIVAISDLFPENAQKVADDLGIPKAVQDYHEILNDPTVDAVLICSSTDTHADIAAGTTTTLPPLKIWQTPARSACSRPLRSLHATRSRPRFLM